MNPKSALNLALKDIKDGFQSWHLWTLLAWQEIQLKYRRSYLGPFWITLNMAIFIYAIGFLYGRLFHQNLDQYYPALASGMLTWTFISSVIIESTNEFITSQNYIKQIKLPYSIYILKLIYRNLIIFIHNITVMIPIVFIFKIKISLITLLIIPSMLLLSIVGFVYGFLLAMIGSRFRDISQIITSLTQVTFFLTPIMWTVSILPKESQHYVFLNPFTHFIELVRNPMLGQLPSKLSVLVTFALLGIGIIFTLAIFSKKRKQIIFWL